MPRKAEFRFHGFALLPIAALCALAIAHPLYDLLVREDNATFFIAHQSKAIDIYVLVFVLSVALPGLLFLILWIVNLWSKKAALTLYVLVIFILLTALLMPASQKLFGDLGWTNAWLGLAGAAAGTYLFTRAYWARLLLKFAAIAAIVSPVFFLTHPSIRSFLDTKEAQNYRVDLLEKRHPNVVMVVFDELPLISLLDENRMIDEQRFPNFARLARTSTWYRNTVTAHTTTPKAVPSIFTGRYTNGPPKVPGAENYPENLVSFLRPTHQLHGVEVVSTFFGEPGDQDLTPLFGVGLGRMADDLLVVLAHVLLPPAAAGHLPSLAAKWSDFRPQSTLPPRQQPVRPLHFRKFIDLLRTAPRSTPSFFYLHMLLPHSPLRFNDDGTSLGNELHGLGLGTRSATPRTFAKNRQDSLLIFQAHLLQTRYADLLLGELIDELEALELFSNALIVVTSDHGIGYAWYDEEPEDIFDVRASEVYWVPFLLKRPGQEAGKIVDERVVTVDILPTIADVLGESIPWPVDGISAIRNEAQRIGRLGTGNPDPTATWLPKGQTSSRALDNKIALFGQHNLEDLYYFGPHKNLIGRHTDSLPPAANMASPGRATLETDLPGAPGVTAPPFYLKGELHSLDPRLPAGDVPLAVALNGIIRATTLPSIKDGRVTFSVRIPPGSWSDEENSVSIFAILETGGGQGLSLARFNEAGSE